MQGGKNMGELNLGPVLAPIFWLFDRFGTRQGYTKLVAWAIGVNLIQALAYYLHGHAYLTLAPLAMAVLCGVVLNESYKTNRAPVDPFIGFIVATLWTCSAFATVIGHSELFAYLLAIVIGAVLGVAVVWSWATYHTNIDVNAFLTDDDEE